MNWREATLFRAEGLERWIYSLRGVWLGGHSMCASCNQKPVQWDLRIPVSPTGGDRPSSGAWLACDVCINVTLTKYILQSTDSSLYFRIANNPGGNCLVCDTALHGRAVALSVFNSLAPKMYCPDCAIGLPTGHNTKSASAKH